MRKFFKIGEFAKCSALYNFQRDRRFLDQVRVEHEDVNVLIVGGPFPMTGSLMYNVNYGGQEYKYVSDWDLE